jgi:hypothetical protein
MTPVSAPVANPNPTAILFARFVGGALPATRLCGLTDLMDECDLSPDERVAFAHFFLDASVEDDVRLPDPVEFEELLAIARA